MTLRLESDEKYILDLVARVLSEPDYRWQHRFPTLLGDPGKDGRRRPLPVDGYFPRHRLIVEYWEKQHSGPVPIMDDGLSVSGMSRGDQRRLYDQRRQRWADANQLRLVILDYRGFATDEQGRILRDPGSDLRTVAGALQASGVIDEPARKRFDQEEYDREVSGGCFICRLVQQDLSLPSHHVIWRGSEAIVFLNRFPTVFGYTLVAPVAHRDQVTGDFSLHEYLTLQRVIHSVAEAIREALEPERVYVLSLGSQATDAHVQWHVVPCPPGLSLARQQLALLDATKRGVLELTHDQGEELANRLRSYLPSWMRGLDG